MKSRKFFGVVWKINGIIILAGGTLAVLTVIASAVTLLGGVLSNPAVPRAVESVVSAEKTDTVQQLSAFAEIAGTRYLSAALTVESWKRDKYYEGDGETRNYLFVDSATLENTWLVGDGERAFWERRGIQPDAPQSPVIGFLYVLTAADTDGDKRLTQADAKAIALSDPSGLGFKEIVKDVDRFMNFTLIDRNRIAVFYGKQGRYYAATADLGTKKIIAERELASF